MSVKPQFIPAGIHKLATGPNSCLEVKQAELWSTTFHIYRYLQLCPEVAPCEQIVVTIIL